MTGREKGGGVPVAADGGAVYSPAEDTLLLIDAVQGYAGERVLEIGVGSGAVIAELASRFGSAVGVDVDPAAVKTAKDRVASRGGVVDFVCGDSAKSFRGGVFDLVVFNPPYLPSSGIVEDRVVDGGRGGVEVSEAWFQEASRCLRREGRIVFLVSSLSDVEGLLEHVKELGFETRVLKHVRFFFEELSAVEASRSLLTASI
ncbi:MAG: methyltransferase domain-containing protein [Thaumarchaeota archaeon]|nr:methyltransferase domain-containing protein [Nitrososphaerota archaeon]MCL5318212.1 methyltransferase domain-containing protein [Nitrososphaerota archaeon]